MKNIAWIVALIGMFVGSHTQLNACALDGSSGFMPENNLNIPVGQKNVSTITEEEFNSIVNAVSDIYKPIARKSGGWLKINANWNDGTVNAYATQLWKFWRVNMFGGLARHSEMTADGFALVVCHELGHHLAGAPNRAWASVEGQSDYYATTKCARLIWEKQNNEEIVGKLNVPSAIVNSCRTQYSNLEDQLICQRSAMGGLSLAKVLGSLGGNANVSFSTPDTSVVSATNPNHPKAQCRLDTYLAGALCDKDAYTSPGKDDEFTGFCNAFEGDVLGLRPLCWYKPSKS
jgi:hypothetical protein